MVNKGARKIYSRVACQYIHQILCSDDQMANAKWHEARAAGIILPPISDIRANFGVDDTAIAKIVY